MISAYHLASSGKWLYLKAVKPWSIKPGTEKRRSGQSERTTSPQRTGAVLIYSRSIGFNGSCRPAAVTSSRPVATNRSNSNMSTARYSAIVTVERRQEPTGCLCSFGVHRQSLRPRFPSWSSANALPDLQHFAGSVTAGRERRRRRISRPNRHDPIVAVVFSRHVRILRRLERSQAGRGRRKSTMTDFLLRPQ